ncbi:MAG: hypothetical protein IJ760_00455 [Bacteroidales bacterium]|nr:hypothetical protein [Bacteroidales bacterium]
MKWNFILFVPALVSVVWSMLTVLLPRRPTRAQLLLSVSMLVMAFSESMLAVYFRGRAGGLFIYDYFFEVSALFCAPVCFLGACSLAEPRGVSLGQRWVMAVPLLFMAVLTATSFSIGPRRYEAMCQAWRAGSAAMVPGDAAWNVHLVVDRMVFPALFVANSCAVLVAAGCKVRLFAVRYNTFYADSVGGGELDSRAVSAVVWCFLPLAAATFYFVEARPAYFKYWLIGTAVVLSALQWMVGRFVFALRVDARQLALLMRGRMKGGVS